MSSENYDAKEVNAEGADLPHVFRYYLARGFIEPEDYVIDVACGHGYGSGILKRSRADSIVGIDYGDEAIMHAKDRHKGIEFRQEDLNEIDELPPCHLSVCIETIEHLKDPERFAKLLKKHTARTIFLTTPIVPTVGKNPNHLHDFNPNSLMRLFNDDQWRTFHHAQHGGMYGIFAFSRR